MDVLTPQQRRRCMQSNKSKGTKPELVLARLLWSCGIRYRKHPKNIIGKPDFCIKKYRLAIFVDGELRHGRNWESKKKTLKGNREFRIAKIERNIDRDRKVTQTLQAAGWAVFRFGNQIFTDIPAYACDKCSSTCANTCISTFRNTCQAISTKKSILQQTPPQNTAKET